MMHKDIHLWIEEIRKYNRHLHLVSKQMTHELEEHVCYTMKLLEHINEPFIADIGSGSGLPAIPYKIMYPESSLTMIERSQKKCTFLRHIIDTLNLKKTELIGEDPLTTDKTGIFDAVMSRAFSPRETLEKIVIRITRPCSRLYYFSTGVGKPVDNPSFTLTGHHEQRYKRYVLNLDIYEITSR